MLEMQHNASFRGASIVLHSMEGRNDRYWKEKIVFKNPIPFNFFYHDDKNDPKFYEDIEEKIESFPWVFESKKTEIRVWGDDIEDSFDCLYDDVFFIRDWMIESPKNHAKSLVDYLNNMKRDYFDPSCFSVESPIGLSTKIKESILARIFHKYQAYFKGASFKIVNLNYEENGVFTNEPMNEEIRFWKSIEDGCWYFDRKEGGKWRLLFWYKDLKKAFNALASDLINLKKD